MNLYSRGQFFDLSSDFNKLEPNRIKIGFGKTGVLQVPDSEVMHNHIRQIEKEALAKLRHPSHSRELIGYLG